MRNKSLYSCLSDHLTLNETLLRLMGLFNLDRGKSEQLEQRLILFGKLRMPKFISYYIQHSQYLCTVANSCIHRHPNTQGVGGVPGRNGTDGQKVSIHQVKQHVQGL